MTDLREAAEMALEALETHVPYTYKDRDYEPIQALRQALAHPEQEPVAWIHNMIEGGFTTKPPVDLTRHPERWTALYSEPKPCPTCEALARTVMMDQTSHDTAPPKREWVRLTDEDKDELLNLDNWTDIVEAVEAKLKEKNT